MNSDAKLFDVTIRRVYTAEHLRRWPRTASPTERTHPEFGETVAKVQNYWDEIHANRNSFSHMYDDACVKVVLVSDEALATRRKYAANFSERCCELAVLRPCVCRVSFLCPLHGSKCFGTHD